MIPAKRTKKENAKIPRMLSIRLGPAGFTGTEAPCKTVNTGVCSLNFAMEA